MGAAIGKSGIVIITKPDSYLHGDCHSSLTASSVGNLDLAIVAGQFPAMQQVIAWDDHWFTGSMIIAP